MKTWALAAATAATASALTAAGLVVASQAGAHEPTVRAVLRDPGGAYVGTAWFVDKRHRTEVRAVLAPNRYVAVNAFHGFHVHANNDPANGRGCQADPDQPSTTWFVSADGHLASAGQTHGAHDGDLSSPLVLPDGRAELRFTTARIDSRALLGRAVVLHAGRDNFGNVPTGEAPTQYTPNDPAAVDLTSRTGNAGDRVACGVIRRA
jgi:Cu-Zn family superoxide dismutase